MNLRLDIVDLRLAAGDAKGARSMADEMAALAHERDIVPAANLALAATAFNDLDDHAHAAELLDEAAAKVSAKNEPIGLGADLGSISSESLGLEDSLLSEIAVEAYRAGNLSMFNDLTARTGPFYRARTWQTICEPRESTSWVYPSDRACMAGGGPSFLVHRAAYAAAAGRSAEADDDLSRANLAYSTAATWDAMQELMNVARISVANGNAGFVQSALKSAAKVADRFADPGDREAGLAGVAALRSELRPERAIH